LAGALEQVEAGEGQRAFSTLRRFAFSDEIEQRLNARIALAQFDREAGRLERGASWVSEYQSIQKENFQWPRVEAFVEAQKIQFLQGKAFAAVKSLSDANGKSQGLAKISIERALSWVVEQQPDIEQALEFEKSALQTGKRHFKREKASESEGLEDVKPGFDVWSELQPDIEERIAALQRTIEIDSYGLDFVLYKEAQEFRNASHPLALDFTNVAAAFGKDGEIGGRVPNADYEMAMFRYNELIQLFPDNPYGQAAKLYHAICTAKSGHPDDAIKQLKSFYREDPDGLYRGEALKLVGDLYLFALWDENNAKQAYLRAVDWVTNIKSRSRALDTYLVPPKSVEISKPPRNNNILTGGGEIKTVKIPEKSLTNRITSDWYLDNIAAQSEWRLGFIEILDNEWAKAFEHINRILGLDAVMNTAHEKGFFNPYHRLEIAKKNNALVGFSEQTDGLKGKSKVVVFWADLHFLLSDFDKASSLYERIQLFSENDDSVVLTRSILGRMLVKRQKKLLDVDDVIMIHDIVLEYPNTPSAPYLLELCALASVGEPLPAEAYLQQIYTNYPNSKFAIRARYNEILRTVDRSNHSKRQNLIKLFVEDFPEKTGYIEALNRLDQRNLREAGI
jgi:tetratricopeptide (TPR) repeat protein